MLTKTVQGTQLTPALILANQTLRNEMLSAWDKTKSEGIEYGGWIYYNHASQSYRTTQKKGDKSSISLTPAPEYKKDPQGYEIVADWHCHPGKAAFACRPSEEDIKNAKDKNHFMFVMTGKKEPQGGWKQDLLMQIAIVDNTPPDYRIWNII